MATLTQKEAPKALSLEQRIQKLEAQVKELVEWKRSQDEPLPFISG